MLRDERISVFQFLTIACVGNAVLNEWPRETLQFETPAERFNTCLASTG